MNIDYHTIITIDANKRSGKPCISGLRITVDDIMNCFAAGMTESGIHGLLAGEAVI